MIVTASDLRAQFGGIGIHFKWMGTSVRASNFEKADLAMALGANVNAIKLDKLLIDTGNKDYKRLTKIRSQLRNRWVEETLPYVETGVRLMAKGRLDSFVSDEFEPRRTALMVAVEGLADKWQQIVEEAPQRLGKLYNSNDYPNSPIGLFDVTLSFPNLEPPGHLPPQVFLQQSEEVQKKFAQALKMGEAMLAEELKKLVDNLAERLVPDSEGKPQKFKSASVENMYGFIEKVRQLGFGSSEELSQQIEKVEELMGGISAQDLRDLTVDGKSSMSQAFKEISESLEGSLESLPRRKFKLGSKKKYDAAA